MDEIDLAQERAEMFLNHALQAARGIPPKPRTLSRFCEDCDEEIPTARRAALPGCTRCASCQEDHERGRR